MRLISAQQSFLPHIALQWKLVLPPINLGVPGGTQKTPVLVQCRLGLVVVHGDRFYPLVEADAIYETVITDTNGISSFHAAHLTVDYRQ